ncbi:hypothetical protein ES703_45519 [subsurface metagenome]
MRRVLPIGRRLRGWVQVRGQYFITEKDLD